MKHFTFQPGLAFCRRANLAAPDVKLQARNPATRILQGRGRARLQMAENAAAGIPCRNGG